MQKIISNLLKILRDFRRKGFFHLLTANMLIQLMAFASQLFVACILSPEDVGRIKIIQTFLSIFSIFAGMGFNASTLKLCSEKRSPEEQKSLFSSAFIFTVLSTVGMYGIVLMLNGYHLFSSDTLIQWLIPLGLFPIISNSLFTVYVSYFQATKRIKLISNLTTANKLLSIAGIVLFTYLWGIKGYYMAYNLSLLFILLFCIGVFSSEFSTKIFSKDTFALFSTHKRYAITSMLAYLFSEMSAYTDIILISFFVKDMKEIGYYSFALTITVVLRLFPSTVQQITIPYFSSLSHQKNEFMMVFKRYNKMFYRAVLLTLIASVILAPFFLHSIFNGKYDTSMQYFPLLAIGWSLRQLALLQNGAIFGLGKIHYNVYTSLIALTFNIVIISALLHCFGLIGAAYGSIPCGLVFVTLSKYYFHKAHSKMSDSNLT
jgi:O-antigen/teichoic acid export membrane protein